MNWGEILLGLWCVASPAIASLWGYKAGFKTRESIERDRQAVRNSVCNSDKIKNVY
jgi:hypothetical protein